jgi:hypothetical protein
MSRLVILLALLGLGFAQDNDLGGATDSKSGLFVSDSTIKYSCPVGQLFTVYSMSVDRVTITCSQPNGQVVTSCLQQSGSVCSGQGQYLAMIVEMPDHSGLISTCCTFKPTGEAARNKRDTQESCSTHKVIPKELAPPDHPKKKNQAPLPIPDGHHVQPKLSESRDFSGNPNGGARPIKGLVATDYGWSVIMCNNENENQNPAPAPAPAPSTGGIVVGKCKGSSECASKCAAVTPGGAGANKKKRDTQQSTLLSSNCNNGDCVCKFDKVPEELKNLPKYGGNGGGGAGFCFSADSTVTTPTGPMRMDQLRVGHQVMVMNDATGLSTFERVDSFIHRRADIETEFYQLKTVAGNTLTLSPLHMVPVLTCGSPSSSASTIYAKDARVGQCLLTHADGQIVQSRIEDVGQVTKTGIFAPLTKSGNLMVDDVVASCYASAYESYFVQSSFYRIYNMLTTMVFGTVESLNPLDVPPTLLLFENINSA